MKRYAYAWITTAFFLLSLLGHWWFGWRDFVSESLEHHQAPEAAAFVTQMARETFENWQSEFLQLLWQVVGLAYFLYVGSPSSKENDDRMEAKVDALIRLQGGAEAERILAAIDERYYRHGGHARPHGHELEPVAVREGEEADAGPRSTG